MADAAVTHPQGLTAPVLEGTVLDVLRVAAASLVCGAAVLLFAVHARPWGYVPLIGGVVLAWCGPTESLPGTSP